MSLKRHIKRLPLAASHKASISASLRGKPKSAEHREKIRQSKLGQKHTEEAKAKMRRAWAARPRGEELVLQRARRDTGARQRAENAPRQQQWQDDLMAAWPISKALFADVKQSGGWAHKRALHDATGRVSSGVVKDETHARWNNPYNRPLEAPDGLTEH